MYYHALICHLPDQNLLKFDEVVMVSTWWHSPIVIKVLWRKLPLEQRKINCFEEEGTCMPISISIIACLVPQLVYFDKIHHLFLLFPFSHFSQMRKATHFMVLGHISPSIPNPSHQASSTSWHVTAWLKAGYSELMVKPICAPRHKTATTTLSGIHKFFLNDSVVIFSCIVLFLVNRIYIFDVIICCKRTEYNIKWLLI
jgi:hypothetical protein